MSDIKTLGEKMAGSGFLRDGDGNKSSGRLMKMLALVMAILPGFVMLFSGLFKFLDNSITFTEYGTQMAIMVGIYAGLAATGEVTQKITGK